MDRRELLQGAVVTGLLPVAGTVHAGAIPPPPPQPRDTIRLDRGWRFHLGHAVDPAKDFGFGRDQRTFAKAGWNTAAAAMPDFDDKGWAEVQVPHDWAIDLPFEKPAVSAHHDDATVSGEKNKDDALAAHGFKPLGRDYPATSVGWYRRVLPIVPGDADRSLWLEFDGVFRDGIVFVNGYVVARNESGYAPFAVDLGDFLDYSGKPNVIAVRVDASLGEGWFYEGAGIYRNVTLVRTSKVHVPQWGTFVRTEVRGDGALVRIATEVVNASDRPAKVHLNQSISGGSASLRLPPAELALAPRERRIHESEVLVAQPKLWSPETPDLYHLWTYVAGDGFAADQVHTAFGIRTIAFDAERGFLLNGKVTRLLGVCNHQDHAGVGSGIPDALHAWRVAKSKEMGANAWRAAHNPPAEAFLDACDRLGMLVIDETRINSSDPEAMGQLERMVRRDRNHPCVIAWSVGNEEPQQTSPRGARVTAAMVREVRALDPTRPTTQAFDHGFEGPASLEVDVIGFNYRTDKIEGVHAKLPHKPLIGSETGSTVSTRGEYATDPKRHVLRSYDTEHPWWATTAEEWWQIVEPRRYIAGGFIWTGFDYRGEPTPYSTWPSVSSQFGAMDLCGFPKDLYWYYRAWWRPEPLVHLFPHWSWAGREGQAIEVWAYSNCDAVELFVNGRSAGRQTVERRGHVAWSVPYAPGRIEARGYRGGKQIAAMKHETVGVPAAVRLSADRRTLAGDGRDVAMVRAEIVDVKGRVVPDANAMLRFFAIGPARVIGVGNGDPNCHEPDRAKQRSAFHGLAQAIVQSNGTNGTVRVEAQAEGLKPGVLALEVGAWSSA